jgi:hypothetical protein
MHGATPAAPAYPAGNRTLTVQHHRSADWQSASCSYQVFSGLKQYAKSVKTDVIWILYFSDDVFLFYYGIKSTIVVYSIW